MFLTAALRRPILLGGMALGLGLVSVLVVSDATHTILAGDPAAYRERVEALLRGGVPYRDVPLEHLPIMLLPMMAAWFLGGAASQSDYVFVFGWLMTLTLVTTSVIMDSLGRRLAEPRSGVRWLVVTAPLFPLVVFRNDPFATLLFVTAGLLLAAESRWWTLSAAAGAFAKVWPAVLALWGHKKGRLSESVSVWIGGMVALGWTFLPGFTSARRSLGLHAETVVGALLGLQRTVSGQPSGVLITTAAYLPVVRSLVVVNAVVGLALLLLGIWAIRESQTRRAEFVALGTVIAGVVLTSQLFSLQYVLWLTPAVALSRLRRVQIAGLVLGVTTTWLAWVWDPLRFEQPWFYGALSFRNGLVVLVAVSLAVEATRDR